MNNKAIIILSVKAASEMGMDIKDIYEQYRICIQGLKLIPKDKAIIILSVLMIMVSQAYAQNQKQVSVTVYNSNLGVVKDVREMNMNSGISTIKLTDVAERIDPTSVKIKLDGEVLEQNYQYDLVSLDKIRRKRRSA